MQSPDFSVIKPSPLYESTSFQLLLHRVLEARKHGKSVVFASGVFDGLHQEHRLFLEKAKEVGGFLVVAIESDVRVRQLKGPNRPLQAELQRIQNVSTLSSVDAAFVLPEDFSSPTRFEEVIWQLKPDIFAVSSHTNHLSYKERVVQKYGGKLLVVHQHNPEVSTTLLHSANQANAR